MAAQQKTVEITIHADGEAVIEAFGFHGVGCKDATKNLELVLAGGGVDNKNTKPKPDYWQSGSGAAKTTR